MTNPLKNIQDEAAKLRLTPAEKSAIKARVFGAPSPFTPSMVEGYFAYSFQFLRARVVAPLAVVLIVFAGAGTAAAAQGSLPGDILYPVKIAVNEQVEVALASTPVAKVQVQATLAQRRVEEAEALSAKGTLTPATSAALATNFEAHAQAAQALTADVSAEDPAAAADLTDQIGSSLATHGAILASLGADSSATTTAGQDNQDGSASLAAQVLAVATPDLATPPAPAVPAASAAVASAPASAALPATTTATATAPQAKMRPMSAATTAPATTGADAGTSTPALASKAADALAQARVDFDATSAKLDATTTAEVTAKLSDIGALMDAGDYARALRASIKLSTLLVAQQKLDKNVISPVLEQHLISNLLSEGKSIGI